MYRRYFIQYTPRPLICQVANLSRIKSLLITQNTATYRGHGLAAGPASLLVNAAQFQELCPGPSQQRRWFEYEAHTVEDRRGVCTARSLVWTAAKRGFAAATNPPSTTAAATAAATASE